MFAANMVLRAQLAEFDASIAELNSRLWVLERARWPIKRQLDRVVYPILTVPPEIMSEIFLRCLPPAPVESEVEHLNPHLGLAPLLLLQVCRTWREIALSTPRLWNCLHLCDSTIKGVSSLNAVTKVMTDWFGRAGSSPLTLTLDPSEASGASATLLNTILSPLAPRLRKLWLDLDRVDELADIGPFPILETLKISCHMDDPGSPLKLFSAAPRLHHLIFTGSLNPSWFILPPVLSEVKCDCYLTIDNLRTLLHDVPFLKKLSCSIYDASTHVETLTHNHLETFQCELHPILGLLRLPALQTLHLSCGHGRSVPGEGITDYLLSFLSSCPCLSRFSADRRMTAKMSIHWFAGMPGPTDLDLFDPKRSFLLEFFTKLDRANNVAFLPRLRTLTFQYCAFELDASILQALSSRRTATEDTAMLESFQQFRPASVFHQDVAASIRGSLEDSTVYACRELVERGMSVHIRMSERPF